MPSSVWLAGNGQAVARAATQALARRGCRVVRSFDLRSAAAQWAVGRHGDCPCHGAAPCACQYVVLLAFAPTGAAAVITIRGRDGACEVQVSQEAGAPAQAGVLDAITLAVLEVAATSPALAGTGLPR
jgi:hypothetical protein